MKPKAISINMCRGEVVDEAALTAALQDGKILGAGLDTFARSEPIRANPLLTLSTVTLIPHRAGPTEEKLHAAFRNGYANVQRVAPPRPALGHPETGSLLK